MLNVGPVGYGGGGGSGLASDFTNQLLLARVNYGEGYLSINSVPEPSTWAMMVAGFGGTGVWPGA